MAARKKRPTTAFAVPKNSPVGGLGRGKYPIPDAAHGRNALARVAQHGSPAEKKMVRAAVKRKFPRIGKSSLHHVPEVEAAGREGPVAQHRERREAGRVGGDRCPEQCARTDHARPRPPARPARASGARAPPSLAWPRRRRARLRRAFASSRSAAILRRAARARRRRRAGRAARSRPRRAAPARRACRRSRAASRTRAPGTPCSGSPAPPSRRCRRSRARSPRGGARPGGARTRPRDPLDVRRPVPHEAFELAAADEAEGQLGRLARGREHRLHPVQRDQLADEQERERLGGRPAGPEDALLGADEADLDALGRKPGELGQVVGVGPRVGDDEIGSPQAPGGRPPRARVPQPSPHGSAHGRRRTCRPARRAG